MKKNKTLLISSVLFLSYEIYILISYIYFYIKKDTYGNVYNTILIYPHFILILIGIIFNFMAYFKNKKIYNYLTIICYIIGTILLFIAI
jgi:hypothetical protein